MSHCQKSKVECQNVCQKCQNSKHQTSLCSVVGGSSALCIFCILHFALWTLYFGVLVLCILVFCVWVFGWFLFALSLLFALPSVNNTDPTLTFQLCYTILYTKTHCTKSTPRTVGLPIALCQSEFTQKQPPLYLLFMNCFTVYST